MLEDLQPCLHCAGSPEVFGGRLEVVIACIDCGMSTPPCAIETTREAAIARLKVTWNARVHVIPTQDHEFASLARRELNRADIPLLLSLLARNQEEWEVRGPLFAAMARKLSDIALDPPAYSEIPSVIADAGRYRKLVRRAKIVYLDGRPWVKFEMVDGLPAEVAEEDPNHGATVEAFIATAVDALLDIDA